MKWNVAFVDYDYFDDWLVVSFIINPENIHLPFVFKHMAMAYWAFSCLKTMLHISGGGGGIQN